MAPRTAAVVARQEQDADDDRFDLEALPDELLAEVFRAAGIQETLKRLARLGSSRLHRAWQRAVRSLGISWSQLVDYDIAIIAKYAGLEQLALGHIDHGLLRAISLAAHSLAGLKRLEISCCTDAFGVLGVLDGCTPLQRSLEELELGYRDHSLTEAELWGLQGLSRLSSLRINCQQLEGSFSGAAGVLTASTLRRLLLDTDVTPSPAQLSVLPGCMTQLTHLELWNDDAISAEQQGLAAAVSRLTNLQHLDTDFALMAPEAQQQSLGRLQQLTCLRLRLDDLDQEPLVVLPQLSRLVVLDTSGTVCNPLPHPSLRRLAAYRMEQGPPTAAAPGLPLQQALGHPGGCPLQELELAASDGEDPADDALLQHLPQLPELRGLRASLKAGPDGRYRHLAALLHRQARTLQELRLQLAAPFEEALPRELPACRVLELDGVSRHTLHVLATCRLPALQELRLAISRGSTRGLEAELDFGWLMRGLPSFKELQLFLDGHDFVELQEAVSALLQGSGVEVSYRKFFVRV